MREVESLKGQCTFKQINRESKSESLALLNFLEQGCEFIVAKFGSGKKHFSNWNPEHTNSKQSLEKYFFKVKSTF